MSSPVVVSSSEPSTHLQLPPPSVLRSALKSSASSRPSSPPLLSPTTSPRDGGSMLLSSPPPPRTTSSSSLPGLSSMLLSPLSTRPSTAATSTTFMGTPASPAPPVPSPGLPIAAQGYTPKVSFDTFENPAASMFSYTLRVESEGYTRNTATRVFLCAASADESGREALDWALECLVQDGDELVVFRGIDQDELDKDHELVREEARELMRQIQGKCVEYDPERKVSIILEFIAGRPTTTLDRLIALYRPDSVVVGTRGQRSVMSGVLSFGSAGVFSSVGSVSKYALSHSPVPVIVVRPESKVRKVVEKRKRDPKRGTHFDEVVRERPRNTKMKRPSTSRI
ncbi:hypothetical protein EDC04DRAFT_464306 [Pisolithus marmoratus]|nr:hypothetical protein EDC04DRAFT_464306 [Pisolithus marmoratus]